MATQHYILLVEDDPGDARLAQIFLEEVTDEAKPEVRWVQTAAAALDMLDTLPGCAGVLLDLGLPDTQGLQGLADIKAHAANVPIIVLSGDDNESLGLSAVIAGAQDYLVKGKFDGPLLKRAFQYASQRMRVEVALVERALHDELTGLPTRGLLQDRLTLAMKRCGRDGSQGAVLFVDLDGFKQINDRLGHAGGDAVLKAVSQRLTEAVRSSDTVARMGGDEFVVVLSPVAGTEDAIAVAHKLLVALREPLRIDRHDLTLSASIGVARFHGEVESAEHLIQRADAAMYVAKKAGRSTVSAL